MGLTTLQVFRSKIKGETARLLGALSTHFGMSATPLPCQRHLYSLPSGPNAPAYINAAARSPMMTHVYKAGCRAIARKMTPWTMPSGDAPAVRALFSKIINSAPEQVALTPSTSHAMSLIAHNAERRGLVTGPADKILIIQDQMSSNTLPWQDLCKRTKAKLVVASQPATLLQLDWSGVRIVAVAPYLWHDGSAIDLVSLRTRCDAAGAWLAVDGTQSIGVSPFDVRKIRPDFLCASVHKWLQGPYGCCLLYVDAKHTPAGGGPNFYFHGIDHHERNRDGADQNDLPFVFEPRTDDGDVGTGGYALQYNASGARCYDAGGRPNPVILPMLVVAMRQVLEWGVPRIEARLRRMTTRIAVAAAKLGFCMPAGTFIDGKVIQEQCSPAVLGLRVPKNKNNISAIDVVRFLKQKKRVLVSARLGAIRISPSVYNTDEEITRLIQGLTEFAKKYAEIFNPIIFRSRL